MRRRLLFAVSAVAVVLAFGVRPMLAQQADDAKVAQGQLVKVDSSAKTITIRTAQGSPMEFVYNDQTKVSGADNEVAGLATKTGTQVSVRWVQRDKERVATEIMVQASKK